MVGLLVSRKVQRPTSILVLRLVDLCPALQQPVPRGRSGQHSVDGRGELDGVGAGRMGSLCDIFHLPLEHSLQKLLILLLLEGALEHDDRLLLLRGL